MNRTDIEYLNFTWSPVVGCTNGCSYCWARRQAKRQKHNCPKCYAFAPHLHPERLDEPLRKREPSVIGVAFMGDLFDPMLDQAAVLATFDVLRHVARHTFVILTKRPVNAGYWNFPPNVVLGVSVEDQASADRLIPDLLACPAEKRIVSIEPMRGPVSLSPRGWLEGRDDIGNCPVCAMPNRCRCTPQFPSLDGVIVGGQTGPDAVAMNPDWVRKVRDDCAVAGVPFFFKQWGEWVPACDIDVCDPLLGMSADDPRYVEVPHANGIGMIRVGRKAAGRTLNGRTHDEVAWTAAIRFTAEAQRAQRETE